MEPTGFQRQEVAFYCAFLNHAFEEFCKLNSSDAALRSYFPLEEGSFYERLKSGVVYCFMLHALLGLEQSSLDIDMSIRVDDASNPDLMLANLKEVIASVKSVLGIPFNIDAQDFFSLKRQGITDFVWYIIRRHFLNKVKLSHHPFLLSELLLSKSIDDIVIVQNEALILEWCNWVIAKSGVESAVPVKNCSSDFSDGCVLTLLAYRLDALYDLSVDFDSTDTSKLLAVFNLLGCGQEHRPENLTSGHPRLILVLLCQLFEKECVKFQDFAKMASDLDSKIHALSRLQSDKQSSQGGPDDSSRIDAEALVRSYESQISSLRRDFDIYKEDVKLEVGDLIESARESERRLVAEKMVAAAAKEENLKQRLIEMIAMMRSALSDHDDASEACNAVNVLSTLSADSDALDIMTAAVTILNALSEKCRGQQKELKFLRQSAQNASIVDGIIESRVREFASRSASAGRIGGV